jgi:acetyltransferase
MQKFLDPASVALIGVPRNTGNGSFNNAETLLRYGFEGKIFPINPNTREISELDINPVIATSNQCIAVDVRIMW